MNTARTLVMLSFLLNLFSCSTPNVASCFDSATFDHVLRYSTWYAETRKTNRVLVNDFEMEVLDKRVIALKQDGYTIARISKEDGITLLPVKQSDRLTNNVHEAYCSLSNRAKIWGERYK
jgi:hypothetical protein